MEGISVNISSICSVVSDILFMMCHRDFRPRGPSVFVGSYLVPDFCHLSLSFDVDLS